MSSESIGIGRKAKLLVEEVKIQAEWAATVANLTSVAPGDAAAVDAAMTKADSLMKDGGP